MSSQQDRISVDIRLATGEAADAQRFEAEIQELRAGLLANPRRLAPRYFYDDRGSKLFEQICELPEYYQTRTEEALLRAISPEIAQKTQAHSLVELGSGAATKTRVLLDAMKAEGTLKTYAPFDVSEGIVRRVAGELASEYPELKIQGIVGDFEEKQTLKNLGGFGRSLIVFLGGTIGNLQLEPDAREFLQVICEGMDHNDHLLLGTDLIKDVDLLHAAYNDSEGITAEFNRNCLRVLNNRFDGDFDPSAYAHKAFFDEETHRIEMWLVATHQQTVHLRKADLVLDLAIGDQIRTEISTKYDEGKARKLLENAGFELLEWSVDPDQLFALSLAKKSSG